MSWTHLESGRLGDQPGDLPIDLYEKSGEFMIRVDGLELMNGFCVDSEAALAAAGVRATRGCSRPRIMIGGLGLGYTLAAYLRAFAEQASTQTNAGAEIVVVEKSADVFRWYEKYFREKSLPEPRAKLESVPVTFAIEDVVTAIDRAGEHSDSTRTPRFDLIVLDVDNGPEPVSGEGNARLYSLGGLEKIRAALNPGGTLLLWSAFESQEFAERASSKGFTVSAERITVADGRLDHFIYACTRA